MHASLTCEHVDEVWVVAVGGLAVSEQTLEERETTVGKVYGV